MSWRQRKHNKTIHNWRCKKTLLLNHLLFILISIWLITDKAFRVFFYLLSDESLYENIKGYLLVVLLIGFDFICLISNWQMSKSCSFCNRKESYAIVLQVTFNHLLFTQFRNQTKKNQTLAKKNFSFCFVKKNQLGFHIL